MKRANVLVALGVALVIFGIGLAWAVGRDTDEAPEDTTTAVVVATDALEPGQSGEDLVATGKVEVQEVPTDEVVAGALSSTSDLEGTIIGTSVEEGGQVVAASLRSSVLRGSAIEIPDGMQAVSITVPFTAGVAGYAGPGDLVNIYQSILPAAPGAPEPTPSTRLMAANVEVLDVSDEVAPRRADPIATGDTPAETTTPGRAGAESITFLLAVDASMAEQIIFASTNDELWLTLVPEDQEPATTPGATYSGPVDANIGEQQ